jgi:hypothetical protein
LVIKGFSGSKFSPIIAVSYSFVAYSYGAIYGRSLFGMTS